MAQPVPNPPPGFDKLSVDEKIEYVESLWDAIVDGPDQVAVPDWHLEILRERAEAHAATPIEARPWSEVRAELRNRYSAARGR